MGLQFAGAGADGCRHGRALPLCAQYPGALAPCLGGGIFVSLGLALARKLLGLYLATVPTYSAIYGTFATLPILLLWIYICWVIFLLGAIIAAYWPSLRSGASRALDGPGSDFALALEVLAELAPLRDDPARGLPGTALARRLHVDRLQIEPALTALTALRWVGATPEAATSYLEEGEPRYVLLADPDSTALAPLLEALLLRQENASAALWESSGWGQRTLAQVLPPGLNRPSHSGAATGPAHPA